MLSWTPTKLGTVHGDRRSWTNAVRQAIFIGVGQAQRANVHCKCVELNKPINVGNPAGSNRAKMLWYMCQAKADGRCEDWHDVSNKQKLFKWNLFRYELRVKHVQNAFLVLMEALRRVQWKEVDSSITGEAGHPR